MSTDLHRSTLTGATALLLLAACTAPPPSQPEPQVLEPVPPPDIEAPDPGESEEFLALLDAADRALADDRLLTPEEDSAYGYYRQALLIAPNHRLATVGMERIVERYIQLAHLAMERQQWSRARSMLDRAEYVDLDHSGLVSIRGQLELLANAERLVLRLDRAGLRERTTAVASELAEFGRHARSRDARVSIRAGSDADGRWIYQQLRRSPGERPIRGQIEIGLPPQVTVLLLSPDG